MKKYTGRLRVLILETPWDPVPLGIFDDSPEGKRAAAEARERAKREQQDFYEGCGPNRNPTSRNGMYHVITYTFEDINQSN